MFSAHKRSPKSQNKWCSAPCGESLGLLPCQRAAGHYHGVRSTPNNGMK